MDIMELVKADGTTEEVEIVMTFKLEQFNNDNYVIYKNKNEYFAAKYIEKYGNTDLITELSEEEKQSLIEVFDKLHEGGVV